MALGFVLGGTDGLSDGTFEVFGDSVGVQVGYALGSKVKVHLRDSRFEYGNDEAMTVYAPVDCHVSKDDVTYGESFVFEVGELSHLNTPVFIKRVDQTSSARDGLVTAPRLQAVLMSDTGAFSDTFASLDTERWGSVTSGAGAVSVVAGELVVDTSGATADAAGAYLKAVVPSATRTYRNKVKTTQQAASNSTPIFLGIFDGVPPTGASTTVVFPKNICMVRVADNGIAPYASMTYYDTGGTLQRWNGSGWQTTSVSLENAAYTLGNFVYVDIDVTPTQFRMTTRDASLNLLHQTAWVNWSAARQPAGSKYVAFGEFMTDATSVVVKSDSFTLS